jgi:hypothetical protein
MRRTYLALLLLPVLAAGCASAQTDKPAVAWRDGMQNWFDTGSVDPDEPPRQLWDSQDEDTLLRRLGYADAVSVGTMRLVSQYEKHSQPSQLTLAFAPEEVLFGSLKAQLDTQRELALRLDRSSQDFELALRVQRQLPGTKYLVFFKQRPDRHGKRRLLWSLYKPSKRLLAEVRTRYHWLEQRGRQAPKS